MIADWFGLRIADCGVRIADCGLRLGLSVALPQFECGDCGGRGQSAAGQRAFPVAMRAALGEQGGAGFCQGAF